jgi:hypothetical protein
LREEVVTHSEALAEARRMLPPNAWDGKIQQLAWRLFKRRAPLHAIVKVLRVSTNLYGTGLVRLDCGHEAHSNATYQARCVRCADPDYYAELDRKEAAFADAGLRAAPRCAYCGDPFPTDGTARPPYCGGPCELEHKTTGPDAPAKAKP